ncbi:MAG: protein TolR [Gammaproteobacteria bacterium TMED182]|nr:protein TolR [Gammaproteobacteria bacterium]RPG48409.1 MAG: protein TolR [Gammaproteobacteria bacterium TMED182]|tara:strand:- start:315 stop:737 length:423 start_codon:yes stop_codon:yes gene_type:complete
MAKAARRRPMSDINVVPYIDVMLVLLVIFMVTAPLMTQGIRVDLPAANSEAIAIDELQQVLVVSINREGQYFLNLGGEETAVALSLLAEQVSKIKAANSNLQVLVEGDADIAYGRVIELMDLLQKIGIGDVGLVTQPARS